MKIDRQLFRIGIPLIDNQHEIYLDLVDSLFVTCSKPNVDQKEVDDSVVKAFAYGIEHFDAEEALMRSVNYPGFEVHRAKHDEFRYEIDRVSESGYGNLSPEDQLVHFTKWLLEWFCEQTQVYDKALASYLKKQGQKSTNKEN